VADLKAAGVTVAELRAAGVGYDELSAVYSLEELRGGFTDGELMAEGVPIKELVAAGATPESLRAAGLSDTELVMKAGFSPDDVMALGPSAEVGAFGGTPFPLKDFTTLARAIQRTKADEGDSDGVKLLEGSINTCGEYDPDTFATGKAEIKEYKTVLKEGADLLERILLSHWNAMQDALLAMQEDPSQENIMALATAIELTKKVPTLVLTALYTLGSKC
jgi:hypothetical protein